MRLSVAGGWLSWQLCLLLLLAVLGGGGVGAVVAGGLFLSEAEGISREMQRRETRIQLLELLVQQQLPDVVASLEEQVPPAPAAPASAPSAPAPAPQPAPAAKPAAGAAPQERTTPAAKHVAAPAPAPQPSARSRQADASPPMPVPAATAAAGPGPVAAPTTVVAAEPVTGEELFAAERNRIEGVAAEKAGVKALEAKTVLLRNGSVVRVGQRFPSGEKLLFVDHVNNRVVTDKRQMLLFFSM